MDNIVLKVGLENTLLEASKTLKVFSISVDFMIDMLKEDVLEDVVVSSIFKSTDEILTCKDFIRTYRTNLETLSRCRLEHENIENFHSSIDIDILKLDINLDHYIDQSMIETLLKHMQVLKRKLLNGYCYPRISVHLDMRIAFNLYDLTINEPIYFPSCLLLKTVVLNNCYLSNMYVSPFVEVYLQHSEVCMIGEHLLLDQPLTSTSVANFNDTESLETQVKNFISAFHNRNYRAYMSLFINTVSRADEVKDTLKGTGVLVSEQVYSTYLLYNELCRSILNNTCCTLSEVYFSNSAPYLDNALSLQGINLDASSTLLYINTCTMLGRIYSRKGIYQYRGRICLSSLTCYKEEIISAGIPFAEWLDFAHTNLLTLNDVCFYIIADIGNYFPIKLSEHKDTCNYLFGLSLANVCKTLGRNIMQRRMKRHVNS